MIFYKNLFYSVAISAFIVLAILTLIMYKAKNKQLYPPLSQACPDYYSLDTNGLCNVNPDVWKKIRMNSSARTGMSCKNPKFSADISGGLFTNNPSGFGPTSGACAKQKWAQDCGVTWDGITTNENICFNDYN